MKNFNMKIRMNVISLLISRLKRGVLYKNIKTDATVCFFRCLNYYYYYIDTTNLRNKNFKIFVRYMFSFKMSISPLPRHVKSILIRRHIYSGSLIAYNNTY